MKKAALLAYFSRSGNTRALANQIHQSVGSDIFEIQPEKLYPTDYDAATKQAKQEQASSFRPKLKTKIKDIAAYDTVFIGYPIWWGTMPMPLFTFLSEYDFSGRTIIPFCTHGGSHLGRSIEDIRKLCPKSTILEGFAIWDRDVKNAPGVSEWLRKLKMME